MMDESNNFPPEVRAPASTNEGSPQHHAVTIDSDDDLPDLLPAAQEQHHHNLHCGHPLLFHDGHMGYLEDGKLFCLPDATRPSFVQQHSLPRAVEHGHGHSHDNAAGHHGHSHGSDSSNNHEGCSEHGHSHGQQKAVTRSVVNEGAPSNTPPVEGHCGSIELPCHHAQVRHGDHFDCLVGNRLRSSVSAEACGEVQRFVSKHDLYKMLANQRANQPPPTLFTELGVAPSPELLRFFTTDKAKWFHDSNLRKFSAMLFLTGSFFVVELVVGLVIGSLALVSDAFHMLSDLLGLLVGFGAVKLSRTKSNTINTFHYARAEVVGAMVNAIFLVSVCFTILLEAIERFFSILAEGGDDSKLGSNGGTLLIVASVGLGMNLIGLVIFGGHGHSHSHGGHGHSHDDESESLVNGEHKHKRSRNLNAHGVFLHILGDALGSVAAIISGLIIWLGSGNYRILADPICTLVITIIIFSGTLPLIKQTLPILLDSVPKSIDMDRLRSELLAIQGVVDVHELHVWSIAPNRILGSMHVLLRDGTDANIVLIQMKMVCHKYSIHSTSIQPEFMPETVSDYHCLEPFCNEPECLNAFCCVPLSDLVTQS
eukprot:c14181_g1_i1.p1 GENE.c14181_g1_i1~~c14181_g1_i1.p1  ORF type:complete len:596 (+),score=127.17 c14181_g1_i1:70-1857(+)